MNPEETEKIPSGISLKIKYHNTAGLTFDRIESV